MLTRKQKEAIVSSLSGALKTQPTLFVVDYRGADTHDMNTLRADLKENGASMQVVKKTLLKRVFDNTELEPQEDLFEGQIALVFGFQEVVPVVKVLREFEKTQKKEKGELSFAIRGGFLESAYMNAQDARTLATLPTYEELVAKAVGAIASPLRGLVGVMSGPQRALVYALKGIEEDKTK